MEEELKNDLIEYLMKIIERAKDGSLRGLIVYGVGERRGAHFGVIGEVGLDDFAILGVRAQMCAADSMREMEERDATARREQPFPM